MSSLIMEGFLYFYRKYTLKRVSLKTVGLPLGVRKKKIKERKREKEIKTWLLTFPKRLITHKTS